MHVRYKNRYGRERSYYTGVRGRHPVSSSAGTPRPRPTSSRERFEGYMREVPCPACQRRPAQARVAGGHRRRPVASPRSARCRSASAPSSSARSSSRRASSRSPSGCSRRSTSGCGSCSTSGLDYLSLDRAAGTLSGGEAQRIRLATQIGSGLVGVLYVLDEPRIGLHQRDNHRLIETLIRLRDLGNTLIVVEHDEDTIRSRRLGGRHRPRRRRARRPGRRTPAPSRTCSTTATR